MIRPLGFTLIMCLSGCGGIANPTAPPSDFSDGNFATNIVASSSCTTLDEAGRNRSWNIGLVKTGSVVAATMQGWPETAAVFSQTNLTGTVTGSSLMLAGYIYDTIVGCEISLCYRAEGTITATQ